MRTELGSASAAGWAGAARGAQAEGLELGGEGGGFDAEELGGAERAGDFPVGAFEGELEQGAFAAFEFGEGGERFVGAGLELECVRGRSAPSSRVLPRPGVPWASSSLPTPDSPRTSTPASVGATRSIWRRTPCLG